MNYYEKEIGKKEDIKICFDEQLKEIFSNCTKTTSELNDLLMLFQHYSILYLKLQKGKVNKNDDYYNELDVTDTLNSINEYDGKLNRGRAREVIFEKTFLNIYKEFEIALNEIYKLIYWTFPSFIEKSSKDKNAKYSVEYAFINSGCSISDLKLSIIERKIIDDFMNKNINDNVLALYSKFNIKKNKMVTNSTDIIKEVSNIRNVLIHNKGIVNFEFCEKQKNYKTDKEYTNGEKINFDYKYMTKIDISLILILKNLKKDISNDFERLYKHDLSNRK